MTKLLTRTTGCPSWCVSAHRHGPEYHVSQERPLIVTDERQHTLTVSVDRLDNHEEGTTGAPSVALVCDDAWDAGMIPAQALVNMTPAQAVALAAMLVEAARRAGGAS